MPAVFVWTELVTMALITELVASTNPAVAWRAALSRSMTSPRQVTGRDPSRRILTVCRGGAYVTWFANLPPRPSEFGPGAITDAGWAPTQSYPPMSHRPGRAANVEITP